MYEWLVFLHVLGVLGFMIGHGVTVSVTFAMAMQKDPDRMRLLLMMARHKMSQAITYGSLLLLLVAGIWAGVMGDLWSTWWLRLSFILLVVIGFAMSGMGRRYLDRVTAALGADGKSTPVGQAELEAIVSRSPAIPLFIIGYGGVIIILWLMMFKPF